jgi:hypothetical protein
MIDQRKDKTKTERLIQLKIRNRDKSTRHDKLIEERRRAETLRDQMRCKGTRRYEMGREDVRRH